MHDLEEVFKPTWHINKFQELDNARSFAIDHGWRATPQKVQVVRRSDGWYYIEPYEENCGCPGLIPPF